MRQIFTDPGVWPYITDDFTPPSKDFRVNLHESIVYLLVWVEDAPIGLFSLVPRNAIRWEAHVSMLRKVNPAVTHKAGREAVEWIWRETLCRRLVAEVPACNKAAIRFGLRAMGMEIYGRDRAAFAKLGKLHDLVCMGVSRPF